MNAHTCSLIHRANYYVIGGCILALAALTPQAYGLEVEQKPLLVAEPLPPNIMFILDDSGSMDWEYLPEGNGCPNTISSSTAYRCRSASFNKLYYDPDVTYLAPLDANGNQLTTTFNAAKHDGYDSGSGTRNLGSWSLSNYFVNTGNSSNCRGSSPNNSCFTQYNITNSSSAAERQNFANWYSFYRKRLYAASGCQYCI